MNEFRFENQEWTGSLEELISGISPSEITFLCGAGISFPVPSAIPTVNDFLDRCLSYCTGDHDIHEQVKAKLRASLVVPRFEVLVDAIRKLADPELSIGRVFDSKFPNTLHRYLANQCALGAAILTTNFDNCIELATETEIERIVFDGQDLRDSPGVNRVIVKPHGSNPLGNESTLRSLVISIQALAGTAGGYRLYPEWRRYLLSLLEQRVIIVVGYSGSDDFDITPLLLESNPRLLVWVEYGQGDSPPKQVSVDTFSHNARQVCGHQTSVCYSGSLQSLIDKRFLPEAPEIPVQNSTGLGIDGWLESTFPADQESQRLALLGTLLLHYSLPELVIRLLDAPKSAAVIVLLGRALFYRAKHRESLETLSALANYSPTTRQMAEAAFVESASYCYLGQTEEGVRRAEQYVTLSAQLNDPFEQISAAGNLAAVLFSHRDYDRSQAEYNQSLRLMESNPSLIGEATANWGLGDLAVVNGQWETARQKYMIARDRYIQIGGDMAVAWLDRNLAEALIHQDRLMEAQEFLLQAEPTFLSVDRPDGLIYVYYGLAQVAFRLSDFNSAAQHIRKAVKAVADNVGFPLVPDILILGSLISTKWPDEQLLVEVSATLADGISQSADDRRATPAMKLAAEVLRSGARINPDLYRRIERQMFGE